jgi:hypothetical protein
VETAAEHPAGNHLLIPYPPLIRDHEDGGHGQRRKDQPCPEDSHCNYPEQEQPGEHGIPPGLALESGQCPPGYRDNIRTSSGCDGPERFPDDPANDLTRIGRVKLRRGGEVTSGLPVHFAEVARPEIEPRSGLSTPVRRWFRRRASLKLKMQLMHRDPPYRVGSPLKISPLYLR